MKCRKFALVVWKLIPLAVMWSVWKWRNDALFDGKYPCWENALDVIISRIAVWVCSKQNLGSVLVNDIVYNLHSVAASR